MLTIRQWAEATFRGPTTLVIECGANNASDTAWLAKLPDATVHAFEPDPRAAPFLARGVYWHPVAVGSYCGRAAYRPSLRRGNRAWTKSGSIKAPTGHLSLHPEVTFGDPIEVEIVTLDAFAGRWLALDDTIDLLWADIQGAEPDMIRGGQEVLARTRYAYLECPALEEYEGQVGADDLLALMPGKWRPVKAWPSDILLENMRW